VLECSISILHQLTRSNLLNTNKVFSIFPLSLRKWAKVRTPLSLRKWARVRTPLSLRKWARVRTPLSLRKWPKVRTPLSLRKWARVRTPLSPRERGRGEGKRLLSSWILLACFLAACLPVTPQPPTPTAPTPTTSATPTPTIVWFPPTATFTPFPTPTPLPPTPDQRPSLGAILFSDDFSEPALWALASNENGRAAFGKGELTIAIQDQKAYVYSLRKGPDLGNFYAEITASPSLCQGADEYGLLLRLASAASFYRFSCSCDGRVRLDRLNEGQASSPQPWLETGVVPIGAPSTSRLGVWASGAEMRFFVNDQVLFTVQDPLIPSGLLGVFARSTGGHALTVNFTDLTVYQINP